VTSPNTAQSEGPSPFPQDDAATVEFRHVEKRYPGAAAPAIRDLSFEVPAGRMCVLVGPSGCGKTTALRLVNRMAELTGGDILLDGRSVRERDPAELRRHIGYAIQQVGLFPHRKVAENVATVPRLLGWDHRRVAARVEGLFELLGLDPDLGDRYPAELSGGQRQRVGVARALAADPPLLLMDEPFGAVDPIARERIQGEFLELQRRLRKTVLFVTHDIDEAIRLGDRVAILRTGGVLAQYATPQQLLMRPADEFVADFVGADRALKRLALARVADVALEPPSGRLDGEVTVDPRASLREALSAMLGAGAEEAVVVDDAGQPAGVLTIEAIGDLLAAERRGERVIP
jgi:osmoprotectant transport system ATP-binding protein